MPAGRDEAMPAGRWQQWRPRQIGKMSPACAGRASAGRSRHGSLGRDAACGERDQASDHDDDPEGLPRVIGTRDGERHKYP